MQSYDRCQKAIYGRREDAFTVDIMNGWSRGMRLLIKVYLSSYSCDMSFVGWSNNTKRARSNFVDSSKSSNKKADLCFSS